MAALERHSEIPRGLRSWRTRSRDYGVYEGALADT